MGNNHAVLAPFATFCKKYETSLFKNPQVSLRVFDDFMQQTYAKSDADIAKTFFEILQIVKAYSFDDDILVHDIELSIATNSLKQILSDAAMRFQCKLVTPVQKKVKLFGFKGDATLVLDTICCELNEDYGFYFAHGVLKGTIEHDLFGKHVIDVRYLKGAPVPRIEEKVTIPTLSAMLENCHLLTSSKEWFATYDTKATDEHRAMETLIQFGSHHFGFANVSYPLHLTNIRIASHDGKYERIGSFDVLAIGDEPEYRMAGKTTDALVELVFDQSNQHKCELSMDTSTDFISHEWLSQLTVQPKLVTLAFDCTVQERCIKLKDDIAFRSASGQYVSDLVVINNLCIQGWKRNDTLHAEVQVLNEFNLPFELIPAGQLTVSGKQAITSCTWNVSPYYTVEQVLLALRVPCLLSNGIKHDKVLSLNISFCFTLHSCMVQLEVTTVPFGDAKISYYQEHNLPQLLLCSRKHRFEIDPQLPLQMQEFPHCDTNMSWYRILPHFGDVDIVTQN